MPGTGSYSFSSGDKHPGAAAGAGSSLEDPPPPNFWHFPDDGLLMSQLLSQQILGTTTTTTNIAPLDSEETKKVTGTNRKRSSNINNNGAKQKQKQKQGIPRKRTGKKDRHSKIYTAHGPRDRRMRLSLQIARKFFDLQDMLGFDKASKTIEWLFSKSKSAIKELGVGVVKHMSVSISTSESEVVSAAKDKECGEQAQDPGVINNIARGRGTQSMIRTSTATATSTKERKSSRQVSFARESRDKARARARERTKEKMKMKGRLENNSDNNHSNPANTSWTPLITETAQNSCLKAVAAEEELQPIMDSVSIIDKFLGIPTTSSMFNYSREEENSEENWFMNNETRIQYSYCAMANMIKESSTGNAQGKNPSIIFMTDSSDQNPSSNLMGADSYAKIVNHHNSDLMIPASHVVHEEISPTSILMSTSDIGLHSHYQQNPSKYHHFY